jgi:MFS family permease
MQEKRFLKRYYLIFFSVLVGPFSTSITIPIFEQLRINFGLSTLAQVSISFSFFMFPYAIFQLFTGSFSDIVNKKLVVIGGFIIFIFGLFLALISVFLKTFILYLIALFIGGVGFSFINPTILAILGSITPESKRGWIMGIYSSSAGIGIILGSLLARFLAKINWVFIFIILPFITIITLILFIIAMKNSELDTERTGNKDTLTFKSVLYDTFTQLKEGVNWDIILIGMCGFFTFFTTITLTNTINEQLRISLETYSESEIINYTSFILTLTGITSITISLIAGVLIKKIKELNLLIIGFFLLLFIIFFPFGQILLYFEILSIIIYIGYAVIWPALFKITIEINPSKRGINSGIVNMLRFLGYSLVGPFYTLFGIPKLFFVVYTFNLMTIIMIIFLKNRKIGSYG